METQPQYNMRVAARLSGVSPHVIRIWERRYGAVVPARSATDRRLYTQADVDRLSLLRRATEAGHSIGLVAKLPTEELEVLVQTSAPGAVEADNTAPKYTATTAEQFVEECYAAIQTLDANALEMVLGQALVELGQIAMLQNVVTPLMHRIGEHWRQGEVRVAQEHMTAATVRTFLGSLAHSSHGTAAPLIVVATPAGQIHELGALMVAATADSEGWRVLYLGPNLPAEEIAGAAIRSSARAVALSIVYPADDPRLPDELELLQRHLADTTTVIVGGSGSAQLYPSVDSLKITQVADIVTLRDFLATLRQPAA